MGSSAANATVNESSLRVNWPAAASRSSASAVTRSSCSRSSRWPSSSGERAGRGDPTLVEDDDAVADPLHLADQVRVEQDGDPAGPQGEQQVADVGTAKRIESARRLVEDDELRAGDQRDCQSETLLHALGEPAHAIPSAIGEAHGGEGLAPLLGGHRRLPPAGRGAPAPPPR